jgi:hypothetical protein
VERAGKARQLDLLRSSPTRFATRAARSLTRSEWLPVYVSRASTAFASDAAAR